MRTGSLGRSSFTGLVRRQAVRRRFEAALAASSALASMAFILPLLRLFKPGLTCPLSRETANSTRRGPLPI